MDRLTLRATPDLLRRFDAAASSRGGRARLLRRLMEEAAQASLPARSELPVALPGEKLTLRLAPADLRALETEAAATGRLRTQWAVALIRARLHRQPQFSRDESLSFIAVQRELRRIGVNINQIARALNTAVLEGAVLDLETAQLAAFADEIRAQIIGLRAAFEGDLAYWSASP